MFFNPYLRQWWRFKPPGNGMDVEILRRYQDRFNSRLKKNPATGCLEWQGARFPEGYGKIHIRPKVLRTHRVAWALANGRWPGEMMVCHSCDNPCCCNPEHLWLGSNSDNQVDAVKKGRRSHIEPTKGQKNGMARITEGEAREIIRLISEGQTNKAIAQIYGISHAQVSLIRLGKSWRHLPRPANDNKFKRYASLS